jgi:hypothetical protein
MAAEVGVKVESTGLACCPRDGWALRADDMKEEEEPDRQDVAMFGPHDVALLRVPCTPRFCGSSCVARTRRAKERLSGVRRCNT